MRKFIPCLISIGFLLPCVAHAAGTAAEGIISSLSRQIETAPEGKAKARLHLYRARQYAKLDDQNKAFREYQLALNQDYAGWIVNEYGYYLYNRGEYAEAYKTARKVIADFPHLKNEAEILKKKAGKKVKEEYDKENPPTIVMDIKVDPNRKTRHDLLRKVRPVSTKYSYKGLTAKSAESAKSATRAGKTTRRT